MDVSICIVSWNTKDLLRKCIQSIIDKTFKLEYEIVVVDNDSKDGSFDMVKELYPYYRIIQSGRNVGFAKANNIAAAHASGKYILYLNPDTEMLSNAIYGMHKYMEKNDDYGAVGCKILNTDGTIQYTCARSFPNPYKQFCELSGINRIFPNIPAFSSIEMHYWDHKESRDIDCISGACMMVRKEVVDALNGFDENIFMYAEDVDLCYRIKKKGWKIYYLADEIIMHHEGASTKKATNKYFSTLQLRDSSVYFLAKHYGAAKARHYKAAVFVGSAIRLLTIPVYLLIKNKTGRKAEFRLSEYIVKYTALMKWSISLFR